VAKRSAIDAGFAGALAAVTIGCNSVATPNAFPVFFGAAALIIGIAVLHDTFLLAFRDELTGLPSRRTMNERLLALGNHYTIAMLDVDHFKAFNDTYGHDVGDQVLRMVAARLARVGGGGRAYRYGGEEFTVIFPGRSLGEAVPYLEALRKEIAHYSLAVRAADRPRGRQSGQERRQPRAAQKTVSVTVSIGVAERNERRATPASVLEAADKALYRAKGKGRNQTRW
jgi:diguanylate cyclase (GGDEF)-like protein